MINRAYLLADIEPSNRTLGRSSPWRSDDHIDGPRCCRRPRPLPDEVILSVPAFVLPPPLNSGNVLRVTRCRSNV